MSGCMLAIGSLYAAGAQDGQGRYAIIVFIYVSRPKSRIAAAMLTFDYVVIRHCASVLAIGTDPTY